MGFISINSSWESISITRLISASDKTHREYLSEHASDQSSEAEKYEREVLEMPEKAILKGFEVVELEEGKSDAVMTLTTKNLKFNKATAVELGYPSYVRMLVDATSRRVAIEPCNENSKHSVPFSKNPKTQTYSVVLKIPALLTAARKLADFEESSDPVSFKGMLYPEDKVVIFDLTQPVAPRRRVKKALPEETPESKQLDLEVSEIIKTNQNRSKRGRPKKKA